MKLELIANTIRQDIIRMLAKAGSGHSAGPLGMACVFTGLFFKVMNPKDKFILSNGHICPVLYATMARKGMFPVKELMTLRKFRSRLQGHPSKRKYPVLTAATGSLGQGVCISVGMALALKLDKKKNTVFCVTSDGEQNEGSVWEAVAAANKYKLNNLVFILDRNKIQISGFTKDVMPLLSLKKKYESFGWKVLEMNGHSIKDIVKKLVMAKRTKKPCLVIANVIPGKGVSFIEGKYEWHGRVPNADEAKKAFHELEEQRRKLK